MVSILKVYNILHFPSNTKVVTSIDLSGRKRFPHLCVVIANGFIAGIVGTCVVVPIGSVLVNLDPFMLLLRNISPGSEQKLIGKLARYILFTYSVQVAPISFRAMYLTAFITSFTRAEILQALSDRLPIKHYIAAYREVAVVTRLMYENEIKSSRTGLTGLFFGLLLGVNSIIIAVDRQQGILIVISILFVVLHLVVLHIFFSIGCKFYNESSSMLCRWNRKIRHVHNRDESKLLKRVLSSLQKISVPAGGVGIIDKDMKVSYLDTLQGYLVDTIMAINMD